MMMTIGIGVANQTEMHKINTTLKSRDRQALRPWSIIELDWRTATQQSALDEWMDGWMTPNGLRQRHGWMTTLEIKFKSNK